MNVFGWLVGWLADCVRRQKFKSDALFAVFAYLVRRARVSSNRRQKYVNDFVYVCVCVCRNRSQEKFYCDPNRNGPKHMYYCMILILFFFFIFSSVFRCCCCVLNLDFSNRWSAIMVEQKMNGNEYLRDKSVNCSQSSIHPSSHRLQNFVKFTSHIYQHVLRSSSLASSSILW